MKTCTNCGKTFKPQKKTSKFCSQRCVVENQRKQGNTWAFHGRWR